MISKGYVGLFKEPLSKELIVKCVESWLARFEGVEQVCGGGNGAVTVKIASSKEIIMEQHQQFRVLLGGDFAWVYLTKGRRIMETTGMPSQEISLCLDVLLELPEMEEIIDQQNDERLDELESEGLM